MAGISESAGETVDFAYLERFAAGDRGVVDEVLTLFRQQAERWTPGLADDAPGWREVVHTVKGAARGIGAFVLGDVCASVEEEGPAALPKARQALAAAVAEIQAYQADA